MSKRDRTNDVPQAQSQHPEAFFSSRPGAPKPPAEARQLAAEKQLAASNDAPNNNAAGAPSATAASDAPAATAPQPQAAAVAQSIEDEDLEASLAYEQIKRRREARKRKRIIIAAIVGVIVLVIILLNVMGKANEAADQTAQNDLVTGTAYMGEFATTVNANGTTEPVTSTVVTPEVDGIVENLTVQEGDSVNEGDVLFTLKNETLDKEVHAAQTAVQAADRTVDTARRAIDDANNAYNTAINEYNNTIAQINAAGGLSADATVPTLDESSLQSAITTAEEAYDTAVQARDEAQEKLNDAISNADKRTVRAPVSGTIVSLNLKNGSSYGPNVSSSSSNSGPAMQISDLSKMKVTVQVNEIDISSINKGQTAKATFSAIPGLELDAVVEHIASVSSGAGSSDSMGTGSSGGVVTYAVDLVIPHPDAKLKPGMTATVTITTQSVPNTIVVPSAAVQDGATEQGEAYKYVTVVDDAEKKQTHEVKVQIVAENSSEAAIKGEVKDGDAVVISAGAGSDAGADGAASATGDAATGAAV